MPRATIQSETCGAIRLWPWRPTTAPGLTVSRNQTPVSKSVPARPQLRKAGSGGAPSPLSAGCGKRPLLSACHASTSASRTRPPAPSKMRPSMRMRSPLAPEPAMGSVPRLFSKMSKPAWRGIRPIWT